MRLMLTRALADAERTRSKLEAQGHEVVLLPVIEMIGTGANWPRGVVDGLLATSAQAFDRLEAEPMPEARRLMPLYLVGAQTHAAAVGRGFSGECVVSETADALVDEIARRVYPPGRFAYLAGRDRKTSLETKLGWLGFSVDVVEVYAARETDSLGAETLSSIRRGLDGILHYSRRSALLFLKKAGAHDIDIVTPAHFCLSEDTAAPLREAGCTAIHIANAPSEADLLALIGRS